MYSKFERKYRKGKLDELTIKLGRISLDDVPQENAEENPFASIIGRLQKYWDKSTRTRDKVRSDQHSLVWARASPALNELVDIGRDADGETLFRKLVTLCILLSGLGSPGSDAVIKETYPALHSVLKVADIGRLADLTRTDREQHLLELAQIVMGIRLFNKDCRKGGEGIADLPELLNCAVETTKSQLQTALQTACSRCGSLTMALNSIYDLENHTNDVVLSMILPSGYTTLEVDFLKSYLCLCWLQRTCLMEIRSELHAAELHVTTCVEQLRETLVQLHETVRYRAAIPTVQVYPLFVQLSLIWRELQYEAVVLSHFSHLLQSVNCIVESCPKFPLEDQLTSSARISPSTTTPRDLKFGNLQLRGFCPWTLIQTGGGLIPGVHVEDTFAFRSSQAAEAWSKDLTLSHGHLHTVILNQPALALFLKVEGDMSALISGVPLVSKEVVETAEVEVQTDVHPVETHIDREYAWSEWELKRRAVLLARLSRCVTKSQQTSTSGFRANKRVQCGYGKSYTSKGN